jgi:hypothetical protein
MKPSNAFNRLKLAGSCCSWWVALYQEHITTKKLYQRQLEEVLKISNIVFIQRKNVLMEKNIMRGSCKHSIHSGTFGLSPAEFPGAISTEIVVLSMGMGKRLENMGM